jgi:hypothetical protein
MSDCQRQHEDLSTVIEQPIHGTAQQGAEILWLIRKQLNIALLSSMIL